MCTEFKDKKGRLISIVTESVFSEIAAYHNEKKVAYFEIEELVGARDCDVTCVVKYMNVNEEYQRSGIGTKITQIILDHNDDKNNSDKVLFPNPHNQASEEFHVSGGAATIVINTVPKKYYYPQDGYVEYYED